MKTKPGVLIFLALIQFLAPLGNILVSSAVSEISPYIYVTSSIAQIGFFKFFVVEFAGQWAAAAATFAIKSWSIPVCGAATLWIMHTASGLAQNYNSPFVKPAIIIAHLLNLGLMIYFLLPAVRQMYLNKRLKWWESTPRYRIDSSGMIYKDGCSFKCKVNDISESGSFFIAEKSKFSIGDIVAIGFQFEATELLVTGKVVNKNLSNNSYGLKFNDLGQISLKKLNNLIEKLERNPKIERRPERGNTYAEFKDWMVHVVKDHKGFVPEAPFQFVADPNHKKIDLKILKDTLSNSRILKLIGHHDKEDKDHDKKAA